MGCDGLMITLEESSPHMHLKKKKRGKKRKKKSTIPFSRGRSDRFFLELDF